VRLDKWLWHARLFRSRSLARAAVEEGRLRLNGARVVRPAAAVGAGDVLTFVQAGRVRVLRILGPGLRRGPAPEAETLYADLDLPAASAPGAAMPQSGGAPLD
jgi:ribosome-associated heat shock protein Hsp15